VEKLDCNPFVIGEHAVQLKNEVHDLGLILDRRRALRNLWGPASQSYINAQLYCICVSKYAMAKCSGCYLAALYFELSHWQKSIKILNHRCISSSIWIRR